MEKCVICKSKIEEIFLGKIQGTIIKGKFVCRACQKKFGSELIKQI